MSSEDSASHSAKRQLNEEEDGDVCSLQDVIDCEKERAEIANAVLGASDATNCSYDSGYVYRQALYCCVTCQNEKKKSLPAGSDDTAALHGICLACSYECHASHELYELYTKRHFRCDCGNSKFAVDGKVAHACKLQPNKAGVNAANKYNHNFNGLYCTCNRPYPEIADAQHTEENSEEMAQCSICEDWFHSNHLPGKETNFPSSEDDYDEMVCHKCMSDNKFLWYYQGYIALKAEEADSATAAANIDVLQNALCEEMKPEAGCLLKQYQAKFKHLNLEELSRACCFLSGWREALCKCKECLSMYKSNQVEFLLGTNDTIKYYEEQGKEREAQTATIDENKLMDEQLSKLNRVSQIEFLHNVNDFKQELKEFLASFAANGQVVKRENVVEFFESLNQKKKRKVDDFNSQMSSDYFCK